MSGKTSYVHIKIDPQKLGQIKDRRKFPPYQTGKQTAVCKKNHAG
jgi:hypothetical protein